MATNKSIRAIARAGNRLFDSTYANAELNVAAGTIVVDIDDRKTQIALAANKHNFVRVKAAGTFTVTIASPGVFTFNSHGLVAGDIVQFTTTGALPTGLTAGSNYYVLSTGLSANDFRVASSYNGTAIVTTGTQSGTHTVTPVSASIIGLTRYGFRIPTTDGAKTWVKLGNLNIAIVDTTSGEVRRILRRTYGEWIVSTSVSSVSVRGISDTQLGFHVNKAASDATATLTSNNTNATAGKIVTLGATTYTFKSALTEAKATNTLTTSSTGAANNDTVVVNGRTYTFKTTLTGVADQVLRTGVIDVDLTNLAAAINGSAGAGTTYGTGTTANTDVSASSVTSHAITLTALAIGTAGNAFTLATTGGIVTRGAALFTGGLASVANEVLRAGSADASLTNLSEAINAGANAGTDYSTATTTANASASASTVTAHAITLTALTAGNTGEDIALTTNEATYTVVAFAGGDDEATNVKRTVSVTVDPRTPSNYKPLRRHFKHYVEL